MKRCECGLVFDARAWAKLPLVGEMFDEGDPDLGELPSRIQLKNCPCGSTIAIEIPPVRFLVAARVPDGTSHVISSYADRSEADEVALRLAEVNRTWSVSVEPLVPMELR